MGKWITDPQNKLAAAKPKTGKRHPLLLYQHFNEQVFWPSVFIVALCVGLVIWDPPQFEPYRLYLSVVLAGTGLILVLTFLFRLAAFVQCRTDGILVRTPLQRLSIPYDEIRLARPTLVYQVFPPDEQPWNWQHFLEPVYGKTVIVIEMDKLPRPAAWLRLWMGKYLVCRDVKGLALLVADWMKLRAEFDEHLAYFRRTKTQP